MGANEAVNIFELTPKIKELEDLMKNETLLKAAATQAATNF